MNRYDDQMPNSDTAVIGGAYPSRRRSENIPHTIVNIAERPRTYQPSTARDRSEQLFGSNFNFIGTTVSAVRPDGTAKKSVE